MKKTVCTTLLLTTMSAAPAYANTYLRAAAGLAMANDSDYHFLWNTIPIPMMTGQPIFHGIEEGRATFKSGYLLNGAVGYDFGGFRLEGEIGYQNNGVERFTGTRDISKEQAVWPPPEPVHESYDDDVSALNISQTIAYYMMNGYIDLNIDSSLISPYIMAGVGLASVTMKYNDAYGASVGSFSDEVFAWQIGVGLSWKASKRTTIEAGYRYVATGDVNFNDNHATDPNDTGTSFTANHTISSHLFMAGFRYSL